MITIGIPVIIVERLSMADQLLGITQGLLRNFTVQLSN